jgi:predicted ATPase
MSGDPTASLAHPSFALAPGQRLAGRYLIEQELGRGGMGIVYRAYDEQENRRVAVKTILSAPGGEGVRRFRLEVRTLKSLQHPHIITVHDSGQANGMPFYVMEYIAGPDLARLRAQRGGSLSVAETITIGVQLGKALAYLHNQGKIHRDIKPANIMLLEPDPAPSLHVKLMDFGLIKAADVSAQLTASGVWLGTLPYLSPEQLKGLRVDRRCDLYALGLVLFELCTGRFPFYAEDPLSLAFRRLAVPPISPWEFQPDLPPALGNAILKLLKQDLNARYALAEEFLADLAPLAETTVTLAPVPPPRADFVAHSPLVGRNEELDRLVDRLHAAWSGAGPFILVEGEAGVGKTRLLQELAGLARQQKGRRLHGACYEGEHLPYGPFAEALRDIIGGADQRVAPLLDGLRSELARLIPALTLLPAEQAPDLEPEQARLRLFDAVTRFLVRLSQRRPIVFILDDLQWADEGTLELLHYLARNSQEAAIFICGTARQEELDEEHPLVALLQAMGRRGLVERLPLARLSPTAVGDMVPAMLPGASPPTLLAERLYREAEGNPFFVEEVLKAWVEEGRLLYESSQWNLLVGEDASLPDGVADVIARRLGRVSGVQRDILGLAAVLGREFNFDVLLRMAPDLDEDALLDVVEELLRARLLEEVDHSHEDRYRFTHNKIQEVVYGRTSASRRRLRRLHRRAGEALEQVYAGRLEQVIDALARHFLQAGRRRGVGYGLQAGDAARAVYANQEALDYYGRALALAKDLGEGLIEQAVALHFGKAEVHYLVGEYEAASKCFKAALELLPQTDLETDERCQKTATAHRGLARIHDSQGQFEHAMIELHAALDALQTTGCVSSELAWIYKSIGWSQMRQGNYQKAIISCNQGLQAAPPGDHVAVAELEDTLGIIYKSLGEYDRAATYHQRSLALREQLDDQQGIAMTCNNLAAVSQYQGNYEQAIMYGQRALTIDEKLGHITGVADAYNNLGLVYREQGEYERAIQHYEQSLTISERIGKSLGVTLAYVNLGEAYWDKGDLAQSIEYLKLALNKSTEMGFREGLTYTHYLLAQVYLAQHDLDKAVHSGQLALDIANELGAWHYQANAHEVLGQAFSAQGKWNQARMHLKTARRLFSDLGDEAKATTTEAALHALDQRDGEGCEDEE